MRQLLQAAEAADPIIAIHRIAIGSGFQIPSGAEELFPRRREDRHAQFRIIAEIPENFTHDAAGFQINRIGFRPV